MDNKKTTLKRVFSEICELFEDAKKIKDVVDTVISDDQCETLCYTGSVIINTLVTKLNDVDSELTSVYSEKMKRKRKKILKKTVTNINKQNSCRVNTEDDNSANTIDKKSVAHSQKRRKIISDDSLYSMTNNVTINQSMNTNDTNVTELVNELDPSILILLDVPQINGDAAHKSDTITATANIIGALPNETQNCSAVTSETTKIVEEASTNNFSAQSIPPINSLEDDSENVNSIISTELDKCSDRSANLPANNEEPTLIEASVEKCTLSNDEDNDVSKVFRKKSSKMKRKITKMKRNNDSNSKFDGNSESSDLENANAIILTQSDKSSDSAANLAVNDEEPTVIEASVEKSALSNDEDNDVSKVNKKKSSKMTRINKKTKRNDDDTSSKGKLVRPLSYNSDSNSRFDGHLESSNSENANANISTELDKCADSSPNLPINNEKTTLNNDEDNDISEVNTKKSSKIKQNNTKKKSDDENLASKGKLIRQFNNKSDSKSRLDANSESSDSENSNAIVSTQSDKYADSAANLAVNNEDPSLIEASVEKSTISNDEDNDVSKVNKKKSSKMLRKTKKAKRNEDGALSKGKLVRPLSNNSDSNSRFDGNSESSTELDKYSDSSPNLPVNNEKSTLNSDEDNDVSEVNKKKSSKAKQNDTRKKRDDKNLASKGKLIRQWSNKSDSNSRLDANSESSDSDNSNAIISTQLGKSADSATNVAVSNEPSLIEASFEKSTLSNDEDNDVSKVSMKKSSKMKRMNIETKRKGSFEGNSFSKAELIKPNTQLEKANKLQNSDNEQPDNKEQDDNSDSNSRFDGNNLNDISAEVNDESRLDANVDIHPVEAGLDEVSNPGQVHPDVFDNVENEPPGNLFGKIKVIDINKLKPTNDALPNANVLDNITSPPCSRPKIRVIDTIHLKPIQINISNDSDVVEIDSENEHNETDRSKSRKKSSDKRSTTDRIKDRNNDSATDSETNTSKKSKRRANEKDIAKNKDNELKSCDELEETKNRKRKRKKDRKSLEFEKSGSRKHKRTIYDKVACDDVESEKSTSAKQRDEKQNKSDEETSDENIRCMIKKHTDKNNQESADDKIVSGENEAKSSIEKHDDKQGEVPADENIRPKKSSRRKHRSTKSPKYAEILNNVPITVVGTAEESKIEHPDLIEDKKLLAKCFLSLPTRTPEQLLQDYNDSPKIVQQDAAADSDSGSSSGGDGNMVSGKRTRTLRSSSNRSDTDSSKGRDARAARRTGKVPRTTRAAQKHGAARRRVSGRDNVDDSESESSDSAAAAAANGSKGGKRLQLQQRNGKALGDGAAAMDGSEESDAPSVVSISSTSEPEIRKPSRKPIIVKFERKPVSEESDESDEDTVPINKLSDKKNHKKKDLHESDDTEPTKNTEKEKKKKVKDLSDSDDSEPILKKSDKKNSKNNKKARKEDLSDSEDSEPAMKKSDRRNNKDKSLKNSIKENDLSDSDDSEPSTRKSDKRNNKIKTEKKSTKEEVLSDSDDSQPSTKKTDRRNNKDKSHKNSTKEDVLSDSDDSEPSTRKSDRRNNKIKSEKKTTKEEDLSDSDDSEPTTKKSDNKHNKKDRTSDSDSDDSMSAKKSISRRAAKKKRVVSDSGSEYAEDEEEDDDVESIKSSASEKKEDKSNKNKRKRIKRVNDSSDDSDRGKGKKGKKKDLVDTRKHIRTIMNKGALNQSTIDAEAEEQDRKKRISDKQKKYNDIYNPEELENAKLDKVVLDIDDETSEEILSVDRSIVKHLKPHQAKGIQFMWNACFESVDLINKTKGSGCILAHCMGLGKTLQVIALIHTLITNSDTTDTHKALVVCPLSTVLNWVAEFKKWLSDDVEFEVYELVSCKQIADRQYKLADWHKHGGVMIMGYDMFRNLSNPDNKRISKKARNTFVTGLVDPGPDLVICDEGHLLKNEKTSISIAMNRIRTLRRIVLTGTPLQNNLKEYFCMVQFVKPNLLGTYKEYLNRFVNPITNGQYTDSTPHDIQIMRKRSHVLHKLLDGLVQRRDYAVLAPYLPPKHEYVIFVTLSPTQISLYDHYLNVIAPQQRAANVGAGKGVSLFKDFQEFQRICTHPRVLLDKSVQDQMAKWKEDEENDTDGSEGSLKEFIDDDDDETSSTSAESRSSGSDTDKSKGGPRRGRSKPPKPQASRTTRAVAAEKGIDVAASTSTLEVANTGSEWWRGFTGDDKLDDLLTSSKLGLLFEILHQCENIGDKVLIFSQSLYSLTVIEYFLSKIDDASQSGESRLLGGYSGSWSLGLDYFRLDGSSSCDNRAAWCKTFNNPKNVRARLFLISTRAGGLGINLVAANRVIIFDVSWNPSHDIQSIYRVYRFGQNKPSYIYRFVSNGTMEMKVYERQVTKQAISKRVIDEQQIDRHYNQNDLAELYKFEPKPDVRPIPPVPKDVLLGELVQDKPEIIYKYHEHHTLLENKEDEELNEDERKAAWEEFENEKKMRQMPVHINNIPIHSIMLGLSNHLKREHPEWSQQEVQLALPGAVQEMQEKMALGDVMLYNTMIMELRNLQQQQQQIQQQRMQDYYRIQQANQQRLLIEQQRNLLQNNAAVNYLQRLYAQNASMNPALNAVNALNQQPNASPNVIETVDIID